MASYSQLRSIRSSHGSLLRGAVALVDAVMVIVAVYSAYAIRFDFAPLPVYLEQLTRMLPIVLLI